MTQDELIELEYTKLKEEQLARIGYRDNMIYLSLVAIGTVCSFAIADKSHYPAFLVLPWLNAILGWLYVVNDEKISAIGRYIRHELAARVEGSKETDMNLVFGWEIAHRSDARRVQRKVIQCAIDLLTFPLSGLLSIVAFFCLRGTASHLLSTLAVAEIVVMVILTWQFIQYEDFSKGK